MSSSWFEDKFTDGKRLEYTHSGDLRVANYIDGVEICNVPETVRFIKSAELSETQQQLLFELLHKTLPHEKGTAEKLTAGQAYAACLAKPLFGSTDIPAQFLLGEIMDKDGLKIKGNVWLSFHQVKDEATAKVIGFEITDDPAIEQIKQTEKYIKGTTLSHKNYQDIVNLLQSFPLDKTTPHPNSKEYARREAKFKNIATSLQKAGLSEISGGMFKISNPAAKIAESHQLKNERVTEQKETNICTLVAVHPYYLEYHDSFGERDLMTQKDRDKLIKKYDDLFQNHAGPLVMVEEESRVLDTLKKLKGTGRSEDTYFVLTKDVTSSLFPYTEDAEFINLLKELDVAGTKFVGGHDCGKNRYQSYDPMTGETSYYSGCLRGLANRIEKMGFPKVETLPDYIYS